MKDSHPRPGRWKRASALALLLLLTGCNYGLRGGGFPDHIRTLYVESFENQTPQFELEQQLFTAMVDDVPSALGVRIGSRPAADALLTGSILGYDDVAQNYASSGDGRIQVLEHQIRISVSVRLLDARQNVILWEGRVSGMGRYAPDTQTEDDGRRLAIEEIVREVIDGAQSQW
ncbi:MAG TPA: LptE family protein [Longimicrobiales bacterium]|nr:LptE family protein [Longimicrobiales bacterium]